MYKKLIIAILFVNCVVITGKAQNQVNDFGDIASFSEIHAYIAVNVDKIQGQNTNIDPHELYLNASSRISRNVKAVGEFEIEHGGALLKMTKLFSEWNIDEKFNVKIGLDFAPFSLQDQIYYSPLRLRKFSSHPISVRQILPTGWRETGAFIFGTFGDKEKFHVKYDFGVFNGLGNAAFDDVRVARQSRQSHDNNENKMVSGRISFNYSKNLQVGASYSQGKYDDANQFGLTMYAGHLIYQKNKFDLVGEYITSLTKDSVRTKTRSGGYMMMGYRFFENKLFKNVNYLEPVIRVQRMDTDASSQDASDFWGYALGFNYSPTAHYKFVIQYEVKQEMFGPQIANDEFIFEVVIDF